MVLKNSAIRWEVSGFEGLDTATLYDILNLRCKVFVVEQNAPYLDMDYKDQAATHLCGYINGSLVAYSRLFRPGDYFDKACIGRVVVDPRYRRSGYGHQLIDKAIEQVETLLGESEIIISAQLYLQAFYEYHGFVKISDEYLEDGIPHIRMKKV